MHLRLLHDAQRLRARIALTVMGAMGGMEPDPVARLCLYRPSFFGRPFLRLAASVMRGPSEWTPGEREMMAALVSSLNTCTFCAQVHTALTKLRLEPHLDQNRIRNWRSLQLESRLAAGLGLVEAFTESPELLTPEDVSRARKSGLSDSMIADALAVAFVFNLINRVASAFGFDWHGEQKRCPGRGNPKSHVVPRAEHTARLILIVLGQWRRQALYHCEIRLTST
jgi:uncharacterized peroxidase-related enzyme